MIYGKPDGFTHAEWLATRTRVAEKIGVTAEWLFDAAIRDETPPDWQVTEFHDLLLIRKALDAIGDPIIDAGKKGKPWGAR